MVLAVIFRLGNPTDDEAVRFTGRLLANFGVAALLPLVSVIVGTAVLGSELDDGTLVHLLSKPVPRARSSSVRQARRGLGRVSAAARRAAHPCLLASLVLVATSSLRRRLLVLAARAPARWSTQPSSWR